MLLLVATSYIFHEKSSPKALPHVTIIIVENFVTIRALALSLQRYKPSATMNRRRYRYVWHDLKCPVQHRNTCR